MTTPDLSTLIANVRSRITDPASIRGVWMLRDIAAALAADTSQRQRETVAALRGWLA